VRRKERRERRRVSRDLLKLRRARARRTHNGRVADDEWCHQEVDAWLHVLSVEGLAASCERAKKRERECSAVSGGGPSADGEDAPMARGAERGRRRTSEDEGRRRRALGDKDDRVQIVVEAVARLALGERVVRRRRRGRRDAVVPEDGGRRDGRRRTVDELVGVVRRHEGEGEVVGRADVDGRVDRTFGRIGVLANGHYIRRLTPVRHRDEVEERGRGRRRGGEVEEGAVPSLRVGRKRVSQVLPPRCGDARATHRKEEVTRDVAVVGLGVVLVDLRAREGRQEGPG